MNSFVSIQLLQILSYHTHNSAVAVSLEMFYGHLHATCNSSVVMKTEHILIF